jgi:Domain of Unknown Function (DUF1080)
MNFPLKSRFLLVIFLFFSLLTARAQSGWTTLFDGKALTGWHSWHKTGVVGWSVQDGTLTPDGTGGDLVTDKEYGDFDLEFEFRIPTGSNSGVIYKVIDRPEIKETYMSGPEFQIIDDKGYSFKLNDVQLTGAAYDIRPPADMTATKPAGEWNKGRIRVVKNHVEHFLNGIKVADYQYGSPEWTALVAKSKFSAWPYATPHDRGYLALQNHSPKEPVFFRNVRIREL